MSTNPRVAATERDGHIDAILDSHDAEWKPLASIGGGSGAPSYVSGDPHGDRLRVRYFLRTTDKRLVGRVWFGPGCEGPPGHAHGGSVASVLDEAMGASAWLAGHPVLAAKITIQFRAMVPIGSILMIEAGVARIDGRKVLTEARLTDDTGTVRADAEGLFVELDAVRIGELAKRMARAIAEDEP